MPGGSSKQTVGYKYYLGCHMAICHGPIDGITEIQVDRRVAWEGFSEGGRIDVDAPFLFGGDSREGGVSGPVDLELGWPTQNQNAYLVAQLGEDVPAFRGVACLVLNQCYMGNNPYLKPWAVKAARIEVSTNGNEQWSLSNALIFRPGECDFDCNAINDNYPFGNLYTDSESTITDLLPVNSGLWSLDVNTKTRWSVVEADFIDDCDNSTHIVSNRNYLDYPLTDPAFYAVGAVNNTEPRAFAVIFKHPGVGTAQFPFFIIGDTRWLSVVTRTFPNPPQNNDVGFDCTINSSINTTTNVADFSLRITDRFRGGDIGVSIGSIQFSDTFDFTNTDNWITVSVYIDQNVVADANDLYCDYTCQVQVAYRENGIDYCHTLDKTDRGYAVGFPANVATFVSQTVEPHPSSSFNRETRYLEEANMLIGKVVTADSPIDACALHRDYLANINEFGGANCPCGDMNPAHIIRECLTDTVWGMGYQDADIDDAAFSAAAATLYSESMGMSILWDREQPLEDFIGEVLRHIDAVLYVSRVTGKFVLKLIREEASVLTLNESNVSSVTDAKRPTISELTNAVSVVYWEASTDEDAAITIHNEALRQIQGVEISTTVQYPGFSNATIASRVAERDLKALSTPLFSCTINASRAAASLNVGDVITLDWPDLEVNMAMRVNEIDLGDGVDNSITIRAVQDVFTTPSAARTGQQASQWVDPLAATPQAAVARVVTETPYYVLVTEEGQLDTNAILNDDPDAGFLFVAGGRQGNEFDAAVSVDSGAGFESAALMDFAPYATLADNVRQTDTTFYYTSGVDITEIVTPAIAQIGEELIKITAVGEDSGGTYFTVGRGILDTTPKEHASGSTITVWDNYGASDSVQYGNGESVDVRMLTRLNTTQLSSAPTDTVTFQSRAIRPYPPGDLKIDGLSYPDGYVWRADHTLTWAHRDRLQQTSGELFDHFTGDIGPEAGVTYRVEGYAYVGDSTVEEQFLYTDVGTMTTWGMDSNLSEVDSNMGLPPDDARTVTLKVLAVRDGYDSWQAAEVSLQVPPFTDSTGEIDSVGFDSIGFDSVAGDPLFSSVSLLLPLDGADGATSAPDESNDANTITFNGSAQLDTAQAKWGVSSAYFPSGASSCLSISESNFPAALTNDFTLEFWYRPSGSAVASDRIFQNRDGDVVPGIYLAHSSALGIQMYLSSSGASFTAGPANYTLPASNQWYHIAIAREGNNVRLFVDGVLRGTLSSSAIAVSTGYTWVFGGQTTSDRSNTGWMDDIRFTEGVARYTAGFTPPSGPFPTE